MAHEDAHPTPDGLAVNVGEDQLTAANARRALATIVGHLEAVERSFGVLEGVERARRAAVIADKFRDLCVLVSDTGRLFEDYARAGGGDLPTRRDLPVRSTKGVQTLSRWHFLALLVGAGLGACTLLSHDPTVTMGLMSLASGIIGGILGTVIPKNNAQ